MPVESADVRESQPKEVEVRTVCRDKAEFDALVAQAKENGTESSAVTIEEERFVVPGFDGTARIRKICDGGKVCHYEWTVKVKGLGSGTTRAKVRDEEPEHHAEDRDEAMRALLADVSARVEREVSEAELTTAITSVRTRTNIECGSEVCHGVTISADTFTTVDEKPRIPPFYSLEFEVILPPTATEAEIALAAEHVRACAESLGASNLTTKSVVKLLRG